MFYSIDINRVNKASIRISWFSSQITHFYTHTGFCWFVVIFVNASFEGQYIVQFVLKSFAEPDTISGKMESVRPTKICWSLNLCKLSKIKFAQKPFFFKI